MSGRRGGGEGGGKGATRPRKKWRETAGGGGVDRGEREKRGCRGVSHERGLKTAYFPCFTTREFSRHGRLISGHLER
jgi:hypothetical protein